MPIPVVVRVYNDRTFEFVTKSPPAAALLKQGGRHCQGLGRSEQREGWEGVDGARLNEIVKTKDARSQRSQPRNMLDTFD